LRATNVAGTLIQSNEIDGFHIRIATRDKLQKDWCTVVRRAILCLSPRKPTIKSMFHLIWYILVGFVAGLIAKSVMHVHMTIFWTIILGIVGSIIGGAVTHMFTRPANQRYHPAGLIFSTLGAILVLFVCYKMHIRFPRV
jgi:uncharacterized membrane protein YeaQ/YmgE (transglycosylase-associated protein family)